MKLKTLIISTITGLIVVGLTLSTIYFNIQHQDTRQLLTDAQDQAIFLQSRLEETEKLLDKQVNKNIILNNELGIANQTIDDLKNSEYKLVYLGNFKYTYYCDERRPHICGGSGVTASGAPTKVGTTIGVDPSVIPLGTTVYMEGLGFRVAQDTGSAVGGKHIDVLVSTHSEALSQTKLSGGVWILVKNS